MPPLMFFCGRGQKLASATYSCGDQGEGRAVVAPWSGAGATPRSLFTACDSVEAWEWP